MGDFSQWTEDERVEWLVKELQSKRPLVPPAMPLTDEVREVRCRLPMSVRSPKHACHGEECRDMAPEWQRVLMAGAHKLRGSEKATTLMTGWCLLLIFMQASDHNSCWCS